MLEIELTTPQQDGTTRVDKPIEMRFSVGSDGIICFFNTSTRVGEMAFGETYDGMNPVTLPVKEVEVELEKIIQKLLALRSAQIEGESTDSIIRLPDYKGFFHELLMLQIFQLAQEQSKSDLILNTAYTDFSIRLSNAISGAENIPALQASLDAVLENLVLADNEREEYLGPLRDAIARCNIPLNIKTPENT